MGVPGVDVVAAGTSVLLMVKLEVRRIVVPSWSVLFSGVGSALVVVTWAVLVTVPGVALAGTCTVIVKVSSAPAGTDGLLMTIVPLLPAGVESVRVQPAGR